MWFGILISSLLYLIETNNLQDETEREFNHNLLCLITERLASDIANIILDTFGYNHSI